MIIGTSERIFYVFSPFWFVFVIIYMFFLTFKKTLVCICNNALETPSHQLVQLAMLFLDFILSAKPKRFWFINGIYFFSFRFTVGIFRLLFADVRTTWTSRSHSDRFVIHLSARQTTGIMAFRYLYGFTCRVSCAPLYRINEAKKVCVTL